MRWVFYSLLVVNLVFLGWQLFSQWAPQPPSITLDEADQDRGSRLLLLSESPQRRKAGGVLPEGGRLCSVVGPWGDRNKAQSGLAQLQASGLDGHVRAVSVEQDRLSWVYLPPYPSREKALQALRELQGHGVDSFIVKDGDDANAISLGYFTSKQSAEGLRVKMRNAGYPAFVRETSRQVTEYWVYLAHRESADSLGLKAFLEGNDSLGLEKVACQRPAEQ